MHVQQDTPVAAEHKTAMQLHMPISQSLIVYSMLLTKHLELIIKYTFDRKKKKKINATYLSTLKGYKYRLKQCGYPLASIPMNGSDFSLDVPLRRRVACLSEPLYKHAAREKLCSPAAPVREHLFRTRCCHSVIHPSQRSASLNGRVLQPQSSGIYGNE